MSLCPWMESKVHLFAFFLAYFSILWLQLSLDQIHTEPPQTPKEFNWAEQVFLPPMSPLRSARHRDTLLDSKISPEDAQAKAWTAYYYDLLQCSLQQQGLPETVDLTKEPRSGGCHIILVTCRLLIGLMYT